MILKNKIMKTLTLLDQMDIELEKMLVKFT